MNSFLDKTGLTYLWGKITTALGLKADKIQEVNHGTSDTTFTLTPNVMHIWGTVSSLNLSLPTDTNSVLDEYLFTFTCPSGGTTLTLPASINWIQDPEFEEGKTYQISIVNNLAGYLTNGMVAGGISTESDPVFKASPAYGIATTDISNWNGKQAALVSGTNIKTINNESLLGSGNISISGGSGGDENVIEVVKVNGTALTPDSNKAVDVPVPTALSGLTDDSTHRVVTDTEKSTWNSKAETYIYDIDASNLDGNGEKIVQSSTPYTAIHAAYQAGKTIYVRLTNNSGYPLILNMVSTSGYTEGGYEFTAMVQNGDATFTAHVDIASTEYYIECHQKFFLEDEEDPVFTASAAHGITSANITSWNNKVSNVQADWNATSGLAVILNKPTNLVMTDANGDITVTKSGTTSAIMKVVNESGAVVLLASVNRGVYDSDSSKWLIGTNGTNSFLMDGNVGIGTTSPSYKLHIDGDAYATKLYLNGSNFLGGNSTQLYAYIGTANPFVLGSDYIRRGTSDTDVTLGTSSYRWANLYSVLGNFSGQITSSVVTGTSPLSVASTTLNTNLNADLLDGIHANGLFTELENSGNNISVTIGGTNKALTVGYASTSGQASTSKKAGDSWTSVVTIGEWSKVLKISSYAAVLLSIRLNFSSQSANVTYLINNAYDFARIVQIGTGGYKNNSNFDIRITRSGTTTIDVEIKTSYAYQSATTQNVVCHAVNIHNSGTLTPYTSYTAGSGTLVDSFTSYSIYSFIGNSLRLNGGSTSTTSPDLYIAGTSWFGGAIKVGNAYIWWDDTNSCLRITGADSSGNPSASIATNLDVSGMVAVYSGSSAPSSSMGKNGDIYIQTS